MRGIIYPGDLRGIIYPGEMRGNLLRRMSAPGIARGHPLTKGPSTGMRHQRFRGAGLDHLAPLPLNPLPLPGPCIIIYLGHLGDVDREAAPATLDSEASHAMPREEPVTDRPVGIGSWTAEPQQGAAAPAGLWHGTVGVPGDSGPCRPLARNRGGPRWQRPLRAFGTEPWGPRGQPSGWLEWRQLSG